MTLGSTGLSHLARRLAAALAVGLLFGCSASGTSGAGDDSAADADVQAAGPQLAVSASDVAFDETALTARGTRAVTVANVGQASLVITGVLVDGAEFSGG